MVSVSVSACRTSRDRITPQEAAARSLSPQADRSGLGVRYDRHRPQLTAMMLAAHGQDERGAQINNAAAPTVIVGAPVRFGPGPD